MTFGIRPAEAAGLVLIRRAPAAGSGAEVLLGRRSARSRFMPGIYVFPGGRVGPQDRRPSGFAESLPDQPPGLGQATRRRLAEFARAALRETFEETGLLLGAAETAAAPPPPLDRIRTDRTRDPGSIGPVNPLYTNKVEQIRAVDRIAVGDSNQPRSALGGEDAEVWNAFTAAGLHPGFAGMRLVARAITPTGSAVRFHTRFFLAEGAAAAGEIGGDGELESIHWAPLESLPELPMADITLLVLAEALAHRAGTGGPDRPAPLFRWIGSRQHPWDLQGVPTPRA